MNRPTHRREINNSANLERVADSLGRLVTAAESIATALGLIVLEKSDPEMVAQKIADSMIAQHQQGQKIEETLHAK